MPPTPMQLRRRAPLLAEPIAIDHRPPVPVAAELDEAAFRSQLAARA